MSDGYRQEVFNVLLARLLQERGVIAAPETILKTDFASERRMPDVIVSFYGLRLVIEGEVSDNPYAEERALTSVRKRVEEGIAQIGVAVVYPASLRTVPYPQLESALAKSELRLCVVTESGESKMGVGDVDYLENALRTAFEQLIKEDVVKQAVAVLDSGVESFAGILSDKDGSLIRIAEILGIQELPDRETGPGEDEE